MSILSEAIGIIDSVTKDLGFQPTFTHEAWIGQSGSGTDVFAAAVNRRGVAEMTRKQRPTASGKMVNVVATITILEAVPDTTPNAGQVRRQPIDPRDIITLPDGTTGPVLNVPDSIMDPGTNRAFHNVIYIGEISSNP